MKPNLRLGVSSLVKRCNFRCQFARRTSGCSYASFINAAEQSAQFLTERTWDALIVGGGHNGLTCAAYLARAGLRVAVLEKRPVLGGAAVTEEIVPGFKFSRASYLQSLLRPHVVRELDLYRHGLRLLPRNPSSFTPTTDGMYLMMGPDAALNYAQIQKFSNRDAVSYPLDLVEFLLMPAAKVLDHWFESEILKATLATDAVIGSMASVHTPGSGYVLLHHVVGETDGQRGIWAYVEGGMGAVSNAIGKAAIEAGAHLVTNAEVKQITTKDGPVGRLVTGVVLADGKEVKAKAVMSNATPTITFQNLISSSSLPEEFLQRIKTIDYASGTTKLNVAVDRLPSFSVLPNKSNGPGPQHFGTIHLGTESLEKIDAACWDALQGLPSQRPIIEMTIPSSLDKTISPPGQHVINLFVQYTPYKLKAGDWKSSSIRKDFATRCFDLIEEYAPGFTSSIIDYEMLTPPDLQEVFGLTGGNIFHGAMGLDALFLLRPVKGWSGYRTPIKGLYMCGAGTHPGGGVCGAPGRNCAEVVINDVVFQRYPWNKHR